jgi:phosphinothricin acetyltransferase
MIRDATPSDAPAIAAIWNPVIRDTAVTFNTAEKSLSDLATMITDRQAAGQGFLVTEAAGRIAGFATYA